MKKIDFFSALIVVIIWGVNFTIIKIGLGEIPPMFLVSLRFLLVVFPGVFFVKKPDIPWKYIISYGLAVGVGQFSCLFYAIHMGMPAGVSSVVLQSQAFFTILLSALYYKEGLRRYQVAGLSIAGLGLYLIASQSHYGSPIPILGLVLTLLGAFFWSISNIIVSQISKKAAKEGRSVSMLSLVVWSSLAPPIPMFLLSLAFDSPKVLWESFRQINGVGIFSIVYLALGATIIGYGLWSKLMASYPSAKVAPLSLLVPVFGLLTSQLVLHERLNPLQWWGCGIIILGLLVANLWPLIVKKEYV